MLPFLSPFAYFLMLNSSDFLSFSLSLVFRSFEANQRKEKKIGMRIVMRTDDENGRMRVKYFFSPYRQV